MRGILHQISVNEIREDLHGMSLHFQEIHVPKIQGRFQYHISIVNYEIRARKKSVTSAFWGYLNFPIIQISSYAIFSLSTRYTKSGFRPIPRYVKCDKNISEHNVDLGPLANCRGQASC